MNYTYQHDLRISGADFDDDTELDYCEDCPNSDGTPCYECIPVYPDNDTYCPKCKQVLGSLLDDNGFTYDICNHCGYNTRPEANP